MKRYAKLVQSDHRGQIVIPKEVRTALHIDEGSGFHVYIIEDEGIFLKVIPEVELSTHKAVKMLNDNAKKIKINPNNITKSEQAYRRTKRGNFEEV